ncbi:GNAT family N-acetyltransferase [Thiospirochaeta perfilievii]|uniref:GNAT family N-acetyltransferase n=1 Tax=Thiospirochaeta perfilievii TaxID=252967 RepID=A0A5C1QE47_9SPIO|nr:GNAT family N-acetyltransferase [Thiospirochaeta perfilievii]QEN05259.1 GNAT family N-acetyltransferase [Thiospirochaeta perfilievii]
MQQQIETNNNKSGISLGIFLEGQLIGQINISNIVYGPFLSCFLGYKLGEKFQGMGYMGEALNKVIDIAFNQYKLHRIEANIIPKNIKSINVVERLNFVNEGLSKKYLKINGQWQDHSHYVLLNNLLE